MSSGRLPPREVYLDAGRMGAACFVVYLFGYFAMGLLYVVIPVVAFALFKTRKQQKKEKVSSRWWYLDYWAIGDWGPTH